MVPIGGIEPLGDLDQGLALDVERDEGLAVEGLEPARPSQRRLGPLAGDQLVERVVAVLAGRLEDLGLDARRRRRRRVARLIAIRAATCRSQPANRSGSRSWSSRFMTWRKTSCVSSSGLARVAQPSEADGVARSARTARPARRTPRGRRAGRGGPGRPGRSTSGPGSGTLRTVAITGFAPPPILGGMGPDVVPRKMDRLEARHGHRRRARYRRRPGGEIGGAGAARPGDRIDPPGGAARASGDERPGPATDGDG